MKVLRIGVASNGEASSHVYTSPGLQAMFGLPKERLAICDKLVKNKVK